MDILILIVGLFALLHDNSKVMSLVAKINLF